MAIQNENGDFGKIIDLVYRAATGEAQWETVLAAITESTSSNYAFYQEQYYPAGETTRFLHDDAPLEVFEAYLAGWINSDPRLDFALRNPTDDLYNDFLITGGDESIYRTPFYTDFLAQFDLQYFAASSIKPPVSSNDKSRVAYLGVNRRQRAGHVSRQDCDLLMSLRPHFEQALAIEAKLGIAESQTQILGDTLDALACGIIVVDGASTIKWANEKARLLLSTRAGISSEKGVLAAMAPTTRKQLRDLICSACGTFQDPRRQPGGTLVVAREFDSPIEVLVAPLPSNSAPIAGLVDEQRNCAVCFLNVRGQVEFNIEQALMALHGLTQSEANLAVELASGLTLRGAAEKRGVTYETARSQIKSIYSKTDTHTQAQLVGLVSKNPATLLRS